MKISLTDFVDIVSSSGLPKANKIIEIKSRGEYQHWKDFYRMARESIVKTHKKYLSKNDLYHVIDRVLHSRKYPSYKDIIESYTEWWGENQLKWFEPARCSYSINGIDLIINPELGLEINGQKYLVKLYFKTEPLSKSRIDIITHLMHLNLGGECEANVKMAVLDIRRKRLITKTSENLTVYGLIDAEMQYISSMITFNFQSHLN